MELGDTEAALLNDAMCIYFAEDRFIAQAYAEMSWAKGTFTKEELAHVMAVELQNPTNSALLDETVLALAHAEAIATLYLKTL